MDGITLIDQDGFYKVMALAGASYVVSELLLKEKNSNFYQVRASYYGTDGTSLFSQNAGIEKRLSHWFGISLEAFAQQWSAKDYTGVGAGLSGYYRWYAFGKKRWSPFIEYGTGGFYGFKKFPQDGSNFTFHLTTSFGLEHTLKSDNRVRMTYGHLHQSNNDLFESNPGLDAKGVTITYLWSWKNN